MVTYPGWKAHDSYWSTGPYWNKATSGTVSSSSSRPRSKSGYKYHEYIPKGKNIRVGGYTGIEKKFVDYTVEDDPFVLVVEGSEMDPATALCLSAVAQGDGESQHLGRVYFIDEIYVHGYLVRPVTEAAPTPAFDALCKVALVLDTQTNGAQLNGEDVYENTGLTLDINAFRNLEHIQRFNVLKSKEMIIRPNTLNDGTADKFSAGTTYRKFSLSHKFSPPLRVITTGTTATVSSIADNSLHILGIATDGNIDLSYVSRCRFHG